MKQYKMESRKATGRYVLLTYNDNDLLIKAEFCGEGWTKSQIVSAYRLTPKSLETLFNDPMSKIKFKEISNENNK